MVYVMLGDSTYCQIKTRCPKGSQLGKLYLRKQHLAFNSYIMHSWRIQRQEKSLLLGKSYFFGRRQIIKGGIKIVLY